MISQLKEVVRPHLLCGLCGTEDLLLTALKVLYCPFLSVALFLPWAQVYRVSDMELVSVLPSAEDEVNVACFHPLAGSGLVYGTKVRILLLSGGFTFSLDDLLEVLSYALL